MRRLSPPPPFSLRDLAWRTAFRLGFPLARLCWRLLGRHHRGALVAIHVGADLLLLRSSYRKAWNFPGGSIQRDETPEAAARRELIEEIGLAASRLHSAGEAEGIWDGRRDHVHFFALQLDQLTSVAPDYREIVEACLVTPEELRGLALTGPVVAYLGRAHQAVS